VGFFFFHLSVLSLLYAHVALFVSCFYAGEIVERASHIFDDAGEAYASMAAIAKRLEAWKRRYLQAYHDAFVSICLPKMFAPYVRLQMLNWDPLAVRGFFFRLAFLSYQYSRSSVLIVHAALFAPCSFNNDSVRGPTSARNDQSFPETL
jgi:hypothetical protein